MLTTGTRQQKSSAIGTIHPRSASERSEKKADLRILLCRVAGHRLAIDMTSVVSVKQVAIAESLPTVDNPVGGIRTARGDLPVFHLAYLLGLPIPLTPPRHIVIVGDGRTRWGVAVDSVAATFTVDSSLVQTIPYEFLVSRHVIVGVIPDPTRSDRESDSAEARRWITVLNVREMAVPAHQQTPAAQTPAVESIAKDDQPAPAATSGRSVALILESDALGVDGEPIRLGFSLPQVREILALGETEFLPCAQASVLGVVDWHERPLVVVDLPRYLGLPIQNRRPATRMAVIHYRPGRWLAFPVCAQSQLIDTQTVNTLPTQTGGHWCYSRDQLSFLVPVFPHSA